MKAFSSYQFKPGFLAELDRNFPSYLSAWDRHDILRVTDKNATHFGYVHNGPAVLPMADIVRGMVDDGVNQADIMRRLGMEDEEIDRLIDRAGMPSRMARQATDFGKSWVPGE